MALSGSKTITVSTYWSLRLSWTATQNINNNTSTITASLYWISKDGYPVNSSATKSGYIKIGGSSSSFTATAGLSKNQTKKLSSYTRTVSHSGDGKLSIDIEGMFDPDVNLNGSQVRDRTVSLTASLNTIPRASSISSSVSFTAGNNLKVEVTRASSSFTHIARVYVGGTQVYATPSGSKFGTSVTATIDHKAVFQKLAQGSSASVEVQLDTYSGSTKINSSTVSKSGTCTAPDSSTTSFGGDFIIGNALSGSITRKSSSFTHTIQLVFGGSTFTVYNGSGTSWSYNTSNIASSLYNLTPNSNTLSGYIRIYTYYDGVQVRSYKQSAIKALVRNSNPTFTATGIAYRDTNSATTAITGNNQNIIQGVSTVYVEIPSTSRAIAKNGSTLKKYTVIINGVTKSINYSTSTIGVSFGTINASSNATMTIKAEDSRGNSTTISKIVLMTAYKPPVVLTTANRVNDFEKNTIITLKGSIAALNIGGTNKNSLVQVQYQLKESTATTYGALTNFTYTTSGINYTATNITRSLDNIKSWDIKVIVKDKLVSTVIDLSVAVGQPILYIDASKKSLGFNDFPMGENEFRINGRLIFGSNQWVANSQGEGAGAMFLNNSDITGVNGIFFNDPSNNNGEGLLFLKSGRPDASTSGADYDNFRILDGVAYMNDNVVMTDTQGLQQLWSGSWFMNDSQTVTPSRKLSDCPNGWIMAWSRYENGSTANSFWNFVYVPKRFGTLSAGGMVQTLGADPTTNSGGVVSKTQPVFKYIYATDTTLSGHAQNGLSPNNTLVLRYVFTW